MNIISALKEYYKQDIRLLFQDKWLIWDSEMWVVYQRYLSKTSILCRTDNIDHAINVLCGLVL